MAFLVSKSHLLNEVCICGVPTATAASYYGLSVNLLDTLIHVVTYSSIASRTQYFKTTFCGQRL